MENASLRPLAARAVTLHPATGFTAPETGARGGSLTRVGQRSGAIIIYDSAKSLSLRERITDFLILRGLVPLGHAWGEKERVPNSKIIAIAPNSKIIHKI